jgi:acylphosphatase
MRRRIVVTGRVQGVFFRDSIRRLASEEGVRGWVGNRSDGAVEAVFEGDPAGVERMLEFARHGPPGARVEGAEVFDEPSEDLPDFRIR